MYCALFPRRLLSSARSLARSLSLSPSPAISPSSSPSLSRSLSSSLFFYLIHSLLCIELYATEQYELAAHTRRLFPERLCGNSGKYTRPSSFVVCKGSKIKLRATRKKFRDDARTFQTVLHAAHGMHSGNLKCTRI